MSKVTFKYEIVDHMGVTIFSCWKDIQMSNAPTQDLIFNDGHFTWKANRSIIYNFKDDNYFVRTVDSSPVDPIEDWDSMFEKLGWVVNR